MVAAFGEKASLGQANGPDVDLIVKGTELYATYETPDGFAVVYDEALGLFCYARLVAGEFQSTGTSLASPPPAGAVRHASEADDVRRRKIQERTLQMQRRSQTKPLKE
jgi:hypothetical protein